MSQKKIFIAGHNGMVGSALVRFLKNKEFKIITRNRKKLDLLRQKDVLNFFGLILRIRFKFRLFFITNVTIGM